MEIAGHVSRQMLSRYSHIRTEAKRNALDDVERKRAAAIRNAAPRNRRVGRGAAQSGTARRAIGLWSPTKSPTNSRLLLQF